MSSLSSVGSSGSSSLYQAMMQGLQSSSIGSSISTQSSLSTSMNVIDQILFSGASASPSAPGDGTAQDSSLDALQQYLSQAYQSS